LTDTQRIRELEDALRPFAELEYDSTIEDAWQNGKTLELVTRFKRKTKIDPADIKRAARALRGR
jgi:hypothetical protein